VKRPSRHLTPGLSATLPLLDLGRVSALELMNATTIALRKHCPGPDRCPRLSARSSASSLGGLASLLPNEKRHHGGLRSALFTRYGLGVVSRVVKTFQHIEPTPQGKIEIYFTPAVNYPSISAIDIIPEIEKPAPIKSCRARCRYRSTGLAPLPLSRRR
jgi:hypothetical protein